MIWRFFKRNKKQEQPKPQRNRGLIQYDAEGCGWTNKGSTYKIQYEVEELERSDIMVSGVTMIRVRIVNISGVSGDLYRQARGLLPAWIPDQDIMWIRKESL